MGSYQLSVDIPIAVQFSKKLVPLQTALWFFFPTSQCKTNRWKQPIDSFQHEVDPPSRTGRGTCTPSCLHGLLPFRGEMFIFSGEFLPHTQPSHWPESRVSMGWHLSCSSNCCRLCITQRGFGGFAWAGSGAVYCEALLTVPSRHEVYYAAWKKFPCITQRHHSTKTKHLPSLSSWKLFLLLHRGHAFIQVTPVLASCQKAPKGLVSGRGGRH